MTSETGLLERRLLAVAGLFLFLYTFALSLSPIGQARDFSAEMRADVWIGYAVWLVAIILAHLQLGIWLPGRDEFIFPAAALLSGWGMLTVWRLAPAFGARQTAWLALSVAILIAGLRLPRDLGILRRYKYLWLTGALLLTAATLLFGVNPLGFGPKMWLGCCGLYMQPSEPMKLLLIAYLAAYMADIQPILALEGGVPEQRPARLHWLRYWIRLTPLIAPTVLMTGLALAILLVQRDLGAAVIYLFLYAAVVYLASGRRSVLTFTGAGVLAAGILGYRLFDVVRVRVDAWLNPWLDPAGRSYQIVQSIMAVANGGVIGRGPGLGSPTLVPLAHSDLIFSALAEETGLIGIIGLLTLIGLLVVRGLRAALLARNSYHRYLSAGLVALLAGQSILIIAGNLRLLPLTGVTLPLLSYGGSSLLTTFICLLLLLHISDRAGEPSAPVRRPKPYIETGGLLLLGLLACSLAAGWWALVRNADLLARTDNQRRYITERYVRRGSILDRENTAIAVSSGPTGEMQRRITYPALSNLIGYSDPTYGLAGIEAVLDEYLRGLEGNPGVDTWWQHLLYGTPPPGLDVRLSIDLGIQQLADDALGEQRGALVVLNAGSGEVLALASHPTFDANRLNEDHEALIADPGAPLFNRVLLGRYPLGDLESLLFPEGLAALGADPLPPMRLPDAAKSNPVGGNELSLPAAEPSAGMLSVYSPLQVALAAAALANDGVRPAPQLVIALQDLDFGWAPLEPATAPLSVLPVQAARQRLEQLDAYGGQYWLVAAAVENPATDPAQAAWSVAGKLPGGSGPAYVVVAFIETSDPELAKKVALEMLEAVEN